ncbi:MAG: MerR family transcriptional regulator [Ardenticatenaceae bacterium]|nr:MerR family transcriptional regulator [Ardenticatenaceae bacterium]
MAKYTIQQAAEISGLKIEALRYYEREGLIRDVHRLPNGHRRYSEQDIQWIEFLICMRDSGMPIRDLKRYVDLCYQKGTGHERCDLLEAHRDAVEVQIAKYEAYLARIEDKIAWYRERLPRRTEQDEANKKE